MRMAYRMGWPLGRTLARLGVPTLIRVEVMKDADAEVFVARSPDVRGMVLEADTLDELFEEVRLTLPEFIMAPEALEHSQATMQVKMQSCHA